jgi:TrmH family RNA methyltransferase
MLSKLEKNRIKSLKDKKIRKEHNEFIAEGSRIIKDLIDAAPERVKLICATSDWCENSNAILQKITCPVHVIEPSLLQALASLKTTKEVLAIFTVPDFKNNIKDPDWILYLDNIRDPGNLGTILRTADWFGIHNIYCSPDCVDPFNNKCIQSSMSSIFRVQVIERPWQQMLIDFKDVKKYAADTTGNSIYNLDPKEIKFICIGNEANGLSEEIRSNCEYTIAIPAEHSLGAESLNAAIATGLIMGWKTFR